MPRTRCSQCPITGATLSSRPDGREHLYGSLREGHARVGVQTFERSESLSVSYRFQPVGDVDVFYREAGRADAPVILLLHGYPTASHMFRELIHRLEESYRFVGPAFRRLGQTRVPPRGQFDYTLDNLAKTVGGLTEALKIDRSAIYLFDYGARTRFRG